MQGAELWTWYPGAGKYHRGDLDVAQEPGQRGRGLRLRQDQAKLAVYKPAGAEKMTLTHDSSSATLARHLMKQLN